MKHCSSLEMTNNEKKEMEKEAHGRLFESDIMLTKQDEDSVDLSKTEGKSDIHVKENQIKKRKAIRNRKYLWPSRNIPIEVLSKFCKNVVVILLSA
mgnify:CR=1 FL=1